MTAGARGAGAPIAEPQEQLGRFGEGKVALFGEMVVVGLVVTACVLTGVLAVAGLAAGTRHLRRTLAAQRNSVGDLFSGVWQALHHGWLRTVGYVVAAALLAFNAAVGAQGLVPGGRGYAAVSAGLAVAVLALSCRAAGLWYPGARWSEVLRQARDVTVGDPVGTCFVLAGVLVGAVVVWMLPPLAVLVPGMLALSVTAAEARRAQRPVREVAD
ncbi:hypothetical protein Athai_37920 [Actinocatenispora thailandica]|uniref:Poxvirus protein I5 n=1 Tax=Actinocatenispora thailandica TaxID=227318 RepID=A0A7R7HYJ0_9ACTN|nr:hypothetical protein [Actinocatenispora thailandica]BCJ36289.1 hypothetical protein Athai_37920 [Actinocatenispora thailandica]